MPDPEDQWLQAILDRHLTRLCMEFPTLRREDLRALFVHLFCQNIENDRAYSASALDQVFRQTSQDVERHILTKVAN